MEEKHIWLMLGGFVSALLLFLALEFLLPTPAPAAEWNIPWLPAPVTTFGGHIKIYDPLPDKPGLFAFLDVTWIPPYVTTKAAIIWMPPHVTTLAAFHTIGSFLQWCYGGPEEFYKAHCTAAQKDPKVPRGLLAQACWGLSPDIPFLPLPSRQYRPPVPTPTPRKPNQPVY